MKKKRDDKKGALELSVNTIVIVVIGVTLLTLGLVFVKNMFDNLGDLSGKTFDKGDAMLEDLSGGSKLTSQTSITVKEGKTESFNIKIGNDGSCGEGTRDFDVILSPANTFDETKVKAYLRTNTPIPLDQGKLANIRVDVVTVSDAANIETGIEGKPSYNIDVTCDGKYYASGGFIIEIEGSFL